MKRINKNVSILLSSAIFFAPLLTNADLSVSSDGSVETSTMSVSSDGSVDIKNQSNLKLEGKNEENKTYTGNLNEEEKTKLGYIMKTLEVELKSIRESITKDNLVEMKTKTEALKNTYLNKAASINTSFKEIIEKRFEVFYKNQFELREKIENKKEKIKDTMSGATIEIKEKIKEVKQTLIVKYKEKFIKQLGNKLDKISDEKLKLILDKVVAKRENISNNAKLTTSSKEKLLAQLDALIEIINDKLGITNNDEINLDEIISE